MTLGTPPKAGCKTAASVKNGSAAISVRSPKYTPVIAQYLNSPASGYQQIRTLEHRNRAGGTRIFRCRLLRSANAEAIRTAGRTTKGLRARTSGEDRYAQKIDCFLILSAGPSNADLTKPAGFNASQNDRYPLASATPTKRCEARLCPEGDLGGCP